MLISIDTIIYYLIFIFPITTILQGLAGFESVNLIVTSLLLVLIILRINRLKQLSTFFFLLTIANYAIAYLSTNGAPYRFNDLFYFPFWCLFLYYASIHRDQLLKLFSESKKFNNVILLVWNAIVFLSFFSPISYTHHWGDGTYFKSFSNGEHRFASTAILIIVLTIYMLLKYKKKKYLFYLVIPTISILMSGARTYLIVLAGALFLFFYERIDNKFVLYFWVILFGIASYFLMVLTPMGEKMQFVSTNVNSTDLLCALTSNRSSFWTLQLTSFFKLGWFSQLFGAGFNFVYDVSNLWAHNDFINILLNFGFLGVVEYLYFYCFLYKKYRELYKMSKLETFVFVLMWFFNAMLNMVYTYICATLMIPFLYFLIMEGHNAKNKS